MHDGSFLQTWSNFEEFDGEKWRPVAPEGPKFPERRVFHCNKEISRSEAIALIHGHCVPEEFRAEFGPLEVNALHATTAEKIGATVGELIDAGYEYLMRIHRNDVLVGEPEEMDLLRWMDGTYVKTWTTLEAKENGEWREIKSNVTPEGPTRLHHRLEAITLQDVLNLVRTFVIPDELHDHIVFLGNEKSEVMRAAQEALALVDLLHAKLCTLNSASNLQEQFTLDGLGELKAVTTARLEDAIGNLF